MKGLTEKDIKYLTTLSEALSKLESNGYDQDKLKTQLYLMGVYFYRQYHHAGVPDDFQNPGLNAPKRVWVKAEGKYVKSTEAAAVCA